MKQMRKGFSLVTAIFFMVLVATIATLGLSLSVTTSKHTTDIFLREQAELLAQSATELAVMNLLQTTFSATNCPTAAGGDRRIFKPNPLNFPDNANPLFTIQVEVVEIFGVMNGCGTPITLDGAGNNPSTGTVILDVTVTSNPNFNIPVTFHRRTIQKL
ncbi:hypothetical protein [Campylobacter sp. CCUG 57310]|uniref:type IV pilus modification PilV family protein n=1 Tax=Campylobacter sp. CCUG 57310 TaxID=2517362 RepID=UPI0020B1347A|nr:hypothetical protein [Campylobacter sp. CCUG 57310]QKF92465.1 hypothetical protein CORI_1277 [Campylobacter sp. CCUG 57310]